jgi:flagellar biosynthetic protein FliR
VLTELLTLDVYRLMLVFARLGSALMVLPGFGGHMVSPRVRLLLGMVVSFLMLPIIGPILPPLPPSTGLLVLLIFGEVTVGVFIGIVAQLLLSAINIAGTFIGFQTGLTNAFSFDPVAEQQSQLLTGFLSNVALTLIFAADLHHLMIRAMIDSYALFLPGQPLPWGDFAETAAHTLTESFKLGIQLAGPLVAFGLVFYTALGVLSRLVPQMQVFFVALPVQVMVGMWLLMVALPTIMLLFLRWFGDNLSVYIVPH